MAANPNRSQIPLEKKTAVDAEPATTSDAVTPAVGEVEDTPLVVSYGGNDYTIDRKALTSNKFLKALEQEKSYTAMEALLGSAQYTLFDSRHDQMSEFYEFIDAFSAAAGSGNS